MRQQPQNSFEPRKRRTWKAAAGAVVAIPALALASTGCGTTPAATPAAAGATAPKLVKVSLLSPSAGTVTSAGRVTVRGTVSPANALVLVQGRQAAVGNGVFTATATVHRGRTTIDVIATAGGATPGSTRVAISRPRKKARPAQVVTVATVVPAPPVYLDAGAPVRTGGAACGDGLSVGPNTTCPFAVNVRAAYEAHGPGTVMAYSPVTHRTYAMSCSRGALVMCTGGNDASVYFP